MEKLNIQFLELDKDVKIIGKKTGQIVIDIYTNHAEVTFLDTTKKDGMDIIYFLADNINEL